MQGREAAYVQVGGTTSEEADDAVVLGIIVDVDEARPRREAGDRHDVAADQVEEARADGRADLADRDRVARRRAFLARVGRERVPASHSVEAPSVEASRGGAAAATWIVRGGAEIGFLTRKSDGVAAAPRPRRG